MKYIVKNGSQLSTMDVVSVIPQLPEGFEVVGLESEVNPNAINLADAELDEGILIYSHPKAIERKLVEIRAQRDILMVENDKAFLIASKKDEDLTEIKAKAQELRDIPQVAETAMGEMNLEQINSYNPFEA